MTKIINQDTALGSRNILGKTVTAFGTVENPLFLAKDVAGWLEHSDVSAMLQKVDEDEKMLLEGATVDSDLESESGNLRTKRWYLTEFGLYEVLMRSRKSVAKKFKAGVKKLLHDLRTGRVQIDHTLSVDKLSHSAVLVLKSHVSELTKTVTIQHALIERDKPKVIFADAVSASEGTILIGDFAKFLRQNDVKTGQRRLFAWLRENGYLCTRGSSYNLPTQRSMELGLFRVKEFVITHRDGSTTTRFTTMLTGRGQIYFVNKFLKANQQTAVVEVPLKSVEPVGAVEEVAKLGKVLPSVEQMKAVIEKSAADTSSILAPAFARLADSFRDVLAMSKTDITGGNSRRLYQLQIEYDFLTRDTATR
jgi:anti-repressor protein